MDKVLIIKMISELILKDKHDEGAHLATKNYPFDFKENSSRSYSKTDCCKIFLKDGFIDRYSGDKLLFPGIIKLLSIEFPQIFKYHRNWKMSETHMIYWELFPTLDHIIPVARGGKDDESNWATTSMMKNSAKSNWTIDELDWELYKQGSLNDWDGLTELFLELTEKKPEYLILDKTIKQWRNALIRAKKQLN